MALQFRDSDNVTKTVQTTAELITIIANFNIASANQSYTLPAANTYTGRFLRISWSGGTGTFKLTITGTINGFSSWEGYDSGSLLIYSNGTSWFTDCDFQEFAYNTNTTGSTNTTDYGYGPFGALIPNKDGSAAFIYKRVQFKKAILPSDIIILEIKSPDSATWEPITSNANGSITYRNEGSNDYGMYHVAVPDVNLLDVYFARFAVTTTAGYGATGSPWTGRHSLGWRWRVRKVSKIYGS